MIDIVGPIFEVVLKKVAESAATDSRFQAHYDGNRSRESLKNHRRHVVLWGQRLEFLANTQPKDTLDHTEPLRISTRPRRFFRGDDSRLIYEEDIVSQCRRSVLLGDPGSGKTTTLKRIVTQLTLDQISNCDGFSNGIILLICRELRGNSGIFDFLASLLHIVVAGGADDKFKIGELERRSLLARLVCDSLRGASVTILIDGADEIEIKERVRVFDEIAHLGVSVPDATIVVSCRSGAYNWPIRGFRVFEIQDLTDGEIEAIASGWVKDYRAFIRAIMSKPYSDLARRPIFLTFFMLTYISYGSLSEKPSDVYRRMTLLIVERWDRERGLTGLRSGDRISIEKMIEIICFISYYLLSSRAGIQFSIADVENIFSRSGSRFDISVSLVDSILDELEERTGLIVQTSPGRYEFSHFSLQEYYAANFAVTLSSMEKSHSLFSMQPECAAIVVAISGEPEVSFSELLLRALNFKTTGDIETLVRPFMRRLSDEMPSFGTSAILGVAILSFLSRFPGFLDYDGWDKFMPGGLNGNIARGSIFSALDGYDVESRSPLTLKIKPPFLARNPAATHEIRMTHEIVNYFRI